PIKVDSIVSNNEIISLIISLKKHTPFLIWHDGPPVDKDTQWDFINKYTRREEVVFGPAIIDNRWKVLLSKKPFYLEDLIKNAIKEKTIALPSHLDLKLKSVEILVKEDLIERFSENKDMLSYLFKLLLGKPSYLITE
ncbi:MAG: hypothetical protein KAS22_06165, partial [Candidatus Heimdallarchaeota archaeon]|nr:hypothetical protein [Candidatus Heimdallarchaeota archaeon]